MSSTDGGATKAPAPAARPLYVCSSTHTCETKGLLRISKGLLWTPTDSLRTPRPHQLLSVTVTSAPIRQVHFISTKPPPPPRTRRACRGGGGGGGAGRCLAATGARGVACGANGERDKGGRILEVERRRTMLLLCAANAGRRERQARQGGGWAHTHPTSVRGGARRVGGRRLHRAPCFSHHGPYSRSLPLHHPPTFPLSVSPALPPAHHATLGLQALPLARDLGTYHGSLHPHALCPTANAHTLQSIPCTLHAAP
jgi:hypothetical protein